MQRLSKWVLIAALGLLLASPAGCGGTSSRGEQLYEKAKQQYAQSYYTDAGETFREAREQLLAEGKDARAEDCRIQLQNIELIFLSYPYSEEEVRELLSQHFPDMPESEIEGWIAGSVADVRLIDGQPRYADEACMNIILRNPDLFATSSQLVEKYDEGYRTLLEAAHETPSHEARQPYFNPVTYLGTGTLDVPREQLPQSGLLRLWFPLPILAGYQQDVRVLSITPDDYVKDPPSFDQDVGLVYMEVPLDELREDLTIELRFSFRRYQQRFEIAADNVGDYDMDGVLYRTYTASRGNTKITAEIEDTARQVVGDETNPYLAARKLYDYVIEYVDYGHLPHPVMWPRGEAESVFVHEYRLGDCGAQSIYFSALCRAAGIPCRTTGGWQLIGGDFAPHFWAEFYLPNYGWIPADTSVAQIPDFIPGLSEEEVDEFRDFLFSGQDHYRCTVQTDVDLPLVPPATEPVLLPMTLQVPAALCDTMEEIPGVVISESWVLHAEITE